MNGCGEEYVANKVVLECALQGERRLAEMAGSMGGGLNGCRTGSPDAGRCRPTRSLM
jgi:hypothetical protein